MCQKSSCVLSTNSSLRYYQGKARGFTMVELLVTLVLLGLIASMVTPGLESWLASRQASAMRMALSNELALLPLKANRTARKITISNVEQLDIDNLVAHFPVPIVVLANGYCLGGQVILKQRGVEIPMNVTAPYCEVKRLEVL